MHWSRGIGRRLSGLVLAALLLVPLVTCGHHHVTDTASTSGCAVCVVAHHTPAVLAAAPSALALALAPLTLPAAARVVPAHRVHSPIAGRAPPLSSSILAIS